jgi:alginate O-acetyltransferase complex protein AlgF
MKKFLLASALAFSFIPAAYANMDSGLYDPAPPEGSAFVRFLSERNAAGSQEAKANGKSYDYLSYKDITSYFVIPHGTVNASVGTATSAFTADEGEFYTIVYTDTGALNVKTDPKNENSAKSQIIFYNLGNSSNYSLKTADGKVEIIPPLPTGETGEREINAVKVDLAVFDGANKIKDLGTISLERAKSYTLVAMDNNEINWTQSSTNTTR